MKVSNISVELLDYMGSDLTVVNAARVSMSKYHATFQDNDKGLIKYLAENGHWSPFAHCFLQLRIKAPIFVARQLAKSTVGLSWNETSRRYVDDEPEFYIPELRKRAPNVKQGSKDEEIDNAENALVGFEAVCNITLETYNKFLHLGVAPEVARAILPQTMMTEWIWSGSLYAFARVCNLRLDSHAQKESRMVAYEILSHMKKIFPVSTKELIKVQA